MPFCTFDGCFANYDKLCKLKEHELKHTGERPFVCTIEGCGKSYCRNSHLSRHIKSHSGQKDYVCLEDGCDHRFVSAENLKKHLKRFHQQCHKCKFEGCGTIFKKRQQLKGHQVTHTGINPYRCEVEGCGMQFTLSSRLNRHMKKHAGRNCPKGCDKTFKSWSLLRKHLSTEHFEEVKCKLCGKTFKKKHKLRLHERVHKDKVDVFICPRDGCDRTYTRISYLQMHIDNYHEGARPFACTHENCTKTFAHKVSLEKHQVVHKPGYVKPQPKPRKNRSTASKISGIINYLEKHETNTRVHCTQVNEDCNMMHVERHQDLTGNRRCTSSEEDFLNANTVFHSPYTDNKEDVLNVNSPVNKAPQPEGSKQTLPATDNHLELKNEDDQSKSLPHDNMNAGDLIINQVNDYNNLIQENQYKSKSVAMNILESIGFQ